MWSERCSSFKGHRCLAGKLTWHVVQKLLPLKGRGLLRGPALEAAWKVLQQLDCLEASAAWPVLLLLLPAYR